MTYLGTKDYLLEVQKGNVPGHHLRSGLGERESMTIVATGEDVWRGNELTPAPTSHTVIPTPDPAGEQMSVVSEDANDTAAGTGVQEIEVHYIDSAGAEQEEFVAMDGLTPVNLAASDVKFVQFIHAHAVGASGSAVGHIKIYKTADSGLVYSMIAAGGNQSLAVARMVPVGTTFYLYGWHADEAQGKRCAFRIRSTDHEGIFNEGVFTFKDVVYLNGGSSGELKIRTVIPAGSIIKISAFADAVGAEGSCHLWGVLVEDGF